MSNCLFDACQGYAPMATMVCPKCGFQQEQDPECKRCGIIVARFRNGSMPMQLPYREEAYAAFAPAQAGPFRRFYRIFRWVALIATIMVIALVLHASPPPDILTSPRAIRKAEAKVRQFQSSAQHGLDETLEMNESELNGWLGANLAIERPAQEAKESPLKTLDSAVDLAKKVTALKAGVAPTVEQVQSSVRDVRIELLEDSLRAYTAFELYGMTLSLVLEGKLKVQDGYLRLNPTSGKLGSLPLLAGTLESAARRLFDSPDNKEKFRLPPHIRDVRVENKQLVIYPR
jgi:hypothetical protein